jgi:hypothetical protein
MKPATVKKTCGLVYNTRLECDFFTPRPWGF